MVLIVSDDQGWTDFGFMKHPHIKTPRLDELAASGALFPQTYAAAPLCRPSLASILTGLYPHQHGICCNDPQGTPQSRGIVANDYQQMKQLPALPRTLAKLGYRSFQTGKYWEQHFSTAGFTDGMSLGQRHGDKGLAIGRQTMQPMFDFIDDCTSKRQPFFVWHAPMLPHVPHTPPRRLLEKYQQPDIKPADARYYAMCQWFDETCGQLLDHLDDKHVRENTIVVFIVDNGWSQGHLAERTGAGNGEKGRGKSTPYEGGVRTPLIVSWPGHVKPGRHDELACSIDIAPTILAACGGKSTPAMQGVNLLPFAAGQEPLSRRTIFGEAFIHTAIDMKHPGANIKARWIRDGDWKLIDSAEPARKLLFNLADDPFERKDLAAGDRDRVETLQKQLDRWWKP